MKVITSLMLAFLAVGCAPKEKFVELSEQTLPKTVSIEVKGIMEGYQLSVDNGSFKIEKATFPVVVRGAGVYISEMNHVLTCDHLFGLNVISSITVCNYNGLCTESEVLFREYGLDLALLKAKTETKSDYVRIADPRKIRVGQEVLAIGNPLGLSFSVSHGIISALGRNNIGVYNMTQSDAFINPGNSGGGLFNMRGELVGINSRMVPPVQAAVFTGLGFSVQSGQIIEFLTRFRGLDKNIPKYGGSYWSGFWDVIKGKTPPEESKNE